MSVFDLYENEDELLILVSTVTAVVVGKLVDKWDLLNDLSDWMNVVIQFIIILMITAGVLIITTELVTRVLGRKRREYI